MSTTAPEVLGVFVGDCQWTEKPPAARAAEADWLAVQEGYARQVNNLCLEHRAPLFIAGDLFDKWDSSHNLVNHVIRWLRNFVHGVYAIPGNHDLPGHAYRDVHRSAYWTLVEAGVVNHLTPGGSHGVGRLTVWPFPYGFEVTPPNRDAEGLTLHVALIHSYVWVKGCGHERAAESQKWGAWAPKLVGYDAAFFGDNHKGFLVKPQQGAPWVCNCGTLMRRHSDEKDYNPRVGLLLADGGVRLHLLDTEDDKFSDAAPAVASVEDALKIDLGDFADRLNALHAEKVDFARVVTHELDKAGIAGDLKTLILKAVGVQNADRRGG